jgi:N-acyl amino acid synthase of PEP-CTERM/exosortase system
VLYQGLQDSAPNPAYTPARPIGRRVAGTLFEQFNSHFETVTADKPDLLSVALQIRYQVYCLENPFEKPTDHDDKFERDQFDSHSVHSLLLHRPTGDALGTVRLVLPLTAAPEESFAIQKLCCARGVKDSGLFPLKSTAEVSRFSLSREIRRTTAMKNLCGRGSTLSDTQNVLRCSSPLMRLGLIQSLARMSIQNGITHWCAVMEPTLLRMLAAVAIRFEPIGSLVDFHGLRQPCFCNVAEVLECVKRERPAFWQVLTVNGTLTQGLS